MADEPCLEPRAAGYKCPESPTLSSALGTRHIQCQHICTCQPESRRSALTRTEPTGAREAGYSVLAPLPSSSSWPSSPGHCYLAGPAQGRMGHPLPTLTGSCPLAWLCSTELDPMNELSTPHIPPVSPAPGAVEELSTLSIPPSMSARGAPGLFTAPAHHPLCGPPDKHQCAQHHCTFLPLFFPSIRQ